MEIKCIFVVQVMFLLEIVKAAMSMEMNCIFVVQ